MLQYYTLGLADFPLYWKNSFLGFLRIRCYSYKYYRRMFFHRTFFPWGCFVPLDVLSQGRFVPEDVLSLRMFCPAGCFVSRMFCPSGRFVPRTFCPWTFGLRTFGLRTFGLRTFCLCTHNPFKYYSRCGIYNQCGKYNQWPFRRIFSHWTNFFSTFFFFYHKFPIIIH